MLRAKNGEEAAIAEILDLYKPLLLRESLDCGSFDEDLYQELCITLLHCIRTFRI
jgi:DNA-directed RNA polymerase specialized sigma24 family protein